MNDKYQLGSITFNPAPDAAAAHVPNSFYTVEIGPVFDIAKHRIQELEAELKRRDEEIEELRLRIAVVSKKLAEYVRAKGENDKWNLIALKELMAMSITELKAFLERHPEYVPSGNGGRNEP